MPNNPPPPPSDPAQVDAAWLAWHLREAGLLQEITIQSVRCEPFGESVGFLSRMAKLVPTYSSQHPELPQSLVLKMETQHPNFRAVADRLRAFDREVGFYQNMASQTPTRLPKMYAGNAEGGGGWLLMEDLSHLKPGDQVHGLSNSQVETALGHIAAVHATFWENPQLQNFAWLPEHDFWFREDLHEIWPRFRDNYELRIGHEAKTLIEWILANCEQLDAAIAQRSHTLVHGDLRGDNLLLGEPGSEDEVLILDWQTVTQSLGAIDVAMLIGGSDPPAERAGHYQELFEAWFDVLSSHGVRHYSKKDALTDLRLALLSCLRIPLKVFLELKGPEFCNAREAQLADCFILRHTSAALEFDAKSAMPY